MDLYWFEPANFGSNGKHVNTILSWVTNSDVKQVSESLLFTIYAISLSASAPSLFVSMTVFCGTHSIHKGNP
jgi:hypothetical protein